MGEHGLLAVAQQLVLHGVGEEDLRTAGVLPQDLGGAASRTPWKNAVA